MTLSWTRCLAAAAGAFALAACGGMGPEGGPSTSREETEELIAAMKHQPQIAAGELRKGPDTALLPAPTFPDPAAHGGHGGPHHPHR